ncbi:50S ribosomal protein L9 [Mycoplasmopsis hyopharyngis]|uniref:50S ribosomal protein L9 n=1 Tax=Mycoplasmopsis hyopharyngis TaxID=29558 RepID=UPI0038732A58
MKVIIIKNCKDGKENTIIEVSDGYGKNFLINKGFAVPYNESTKKQLDKKLDKLVQDEMEVRKQALELKEQIEKENLKFYLDATIDANHNQIVHGCVSTKEVLKKLHALNYKLDKYSVQNVRLVQQGIHFVDVIVYKDIVAKLRLEIYVDNKK